MLRTRYPVSRNHPQSSFDERRSSDKPIRSCNIKWAVVLIYLGFFLPHDIAAAAPSGQEIIEKSKTAMESTMKYQVAIAGDTATTVVYQKKLSDDTLVSRCEITSGTSKIVYVFSSNGNYRLFPGSHGVIDLNFMRQIGQSANTYSPFAHISLSTAEWKGFASYNAETCYKIQASIAPLATNLSAIYQAKHIPIPDACQYLIETNTYHVLQMTMLRGNSTFSSLEFKDFEVSSNMSDALFTIPENSNISKPASLEEYSQMTVKYLVRPPKNIAKGFAYDPETGYVLKVDPKTGALIPFTNMIGSSGYQFGAPGNQKKARIFVIAILITLTICFLTFIIKNQIRAKKPI